MVVAVFSIANGNTAMGIAEFLGAAAGILNHIWNTGESLFQPVCITVIGAAAAGASFRKRGDHWNSEED